MTFFQVQTIMWPSTAGGAVSADTIVIPLRSSLHQNASMVLGRPTFNYSADEEGVGVPFFTRSRAADDTPHARWRKRQGEQLSLTGPWPIPVAVADAPPNTTPLVVGKIIETPPAHIRARRINQWRGGDFTARWQFPANIPSTNYTGLGSCGLLNEIQRHMLETFVDDGFTWSLWTAEEVRKYFDQRITRFIRETGLLQARITMPIVNGQATYALPQDLLEILSVYAMTSPAAVGGGGEYSLQPIDEYQLDNSRIGWEAEGPDLPEFFIHDNKNLLEITIVPTPVLPSGGGLIPGTNSIEVIYVKNPDALTETCMPLVLPNVFTQYIKWGIISDMLFKEGEANDPERAQYGEDRFREGVELAQLMLGTFDGS